MAFVCLVNVSNNYSNGKPSQKRKERTTRKQQMTYEIKLNGNDHMVASSKGILDIMSLVYLQIRDKDSSLPKEKIVSLEIIEVVDTFGSLAESLAEELKEN